MTNYGYSDFDICRHFIEHEQNESLSSWGKRLRVLAVVWLNFHSEIRILQNLYPLLWADSSQYLQPCLIRPVVVSVHDFFGKVWWSESAFESCGWVIRGQRSFPSAQINWKWEREQRSLVQFQMCVTTNREGPTTCHFGVVTKCHLQPSEEAI